MFLCTYGISIPLLRLPVSEMAAVALGTLAGHFKVLAQLRLVGVRKVLQLLLGCHTGRILCIGLVLIQLLAESNSSETWISSQAWEAQGTDVVTQIGKVT